jgi:hypothetical protein
MAFALASAALLDRLGNVCQRVSSVSVCTAWPIVVLTVRRRARRGGQMGDGVRSQLLTIHVGHVRHPIAGRFQALVRACSSEQIGDQAGLGRHVHIHIPLREGHVCPLQFAVLAASVGIGPEQVPQQNMVQICLAALDDQVQVMGREIGLPRRLECLSALDSQIAHPSIAERTQRVDDPTDPGHIGHHDVHIDGRLCRQSRNGRRPDVVDAESELLHRWPDIRPRSFEPLRPSRVIVDHDNLLGDRHGPHLEAPLDTDGRKAVVAADVVLFVRLPDRCLPGLDLAALSVASADPTRTGHDGEELRKPRSVAADQAAPRQMKDLHPALRVVPGQSADSEVRTESVNWDRHLGIESKDPHPPNVARRSRRPEALARPVARSVRAGTLE